MRSFELFQRSPNDANFYLKFYYTIFNRLIFKILLNYYLKILNNTFLNDFLVVKS